VSAERKHVEIIVSANETQTVAATPRSNRLPLLVAGALLIAVCAWKFGKPAEKPTLNRANAAVPVVLATAAQADVSDYVTGIGTIQASATATVRVRIDGQLQQIKFVEGQDVKAGDVIAQMDPRALQAQLSLAEAQLSRDQAMLDNGKADLQRYAELVKNGSISKQALDTQKATVAQQEATLRASQAAVNYARVQLDYTTVRAPISGRTGVRLIDVGNLARSSEATGIVVINQIDPITLNFTLPEASFTRVNDAIKHSKGKALPVLAFSNDSDEPLAEGNLLLVNNQIDTASGTIQLKAVFANKEHRLWPGQYINARLMLGDTRAALVIPAGAVQRGPDGTFVYTVQADNTVAVTPVDVVRIQDDQAVLSGGLQPGQQLVAEGQSKLRAGSVVVDQHAGHAP
jgi:multidrug efflux system membrane fusion protein